MSENVIYSINGPVVKVQNAVDFSMLEKVYVGHKRLMGRGDFHQQRGNDDSGV